MTKSNIFLTISHRKQTVCLMWAFFWNARISSTVYKRESLNMPSAKTIMRGKITKELKCKRIEVMVTIDNLMFWKGDHEEYNAFKHLLPHKIHPEC